MIPTGPKRTGSCHGTHSGVLLAINAYADSTSIFDAYISIDPSIWWDERMMAERVNAIPSASFCKKLYLATANQGAANFERNKKRHDSFYTLLTERSNEPQHITIEYFHHENHRSVPLKAIYEGLDLFMLPTIHKIQTDWCWIEIIKKCEL